MKSKKILLSVLSVAVLCAALLGILFTGATAEETVVLYAVGDLQVAGATQVESIQDALADLEKNSRKWSADTKAEIRIQGNDHSGGAQNGVLFGQTTIWREDGTKLPIKILGVDTAESCDAYIYLDGAGGWYACANDYTFENLTLPAADQETFFYAGSGNVTVTNCVLGINGKLTVETVSDRTATYLNAKATAEYIAADAAGLITPDVGRLPCGDAWQKVRTSAEYHATGEVKLDKNGDAYVDKDPTGANGTGYGDYSHAGNTGGGQYLNACVYYEVIFGLECKDNPWRPTKYELDEDLVPILQKAAHEAVLEVYGEDHFKNPIDADIVGNDGVVNLLMVGSSSSYYMRDELHFMADQIGIKLRVVHAYSSGIKMSTQWSWAKNGTGKWTVYTEWDGKTSDGVQNQKLADFINDYPWDIIVTYQTGGSFNKKNLGGGYNDETVAKAIASCDKADEFINYMYAYNENSNAGARYFWFQPVGAPIGAPGPGSDAKGWFFGDNCTTAVYAGWTAEDLARYSEDGKLVSSLTLGDGFTYGGKVSAVGFMTTAPEETYTDESAKAVKFIEGSGFENYAIPEVLPVNTVGKIVVDGGEISGDPQVHRGHSPASGMIHVKGGGTGSITTCAHDTVARYGDVTIRVTGGTVEQVDALRNGTLIGNLKFYMDESDGEAALGAMLRMTFSAKSVSGDIIAEAYGGTFGGSIYPGGPTDGVVSNTFVNCELNANFYGVRSGACKRVVNTVKNCTIAGEYYGGHYGSTTLQVVENYIEGTTFKGEFHGGSRTTGKISGGEVTIDGKKEEVSIYNKISGSTFNSAFYGGNGESANVASTLWNDIGEGNTFVGRYYAGGTGYVKGPITNRINGDSVFKDNFYGSTSGKSAGDVITEVSGNPIFEGTFSAMGYDASADDSEGKTLTTKISGGTFKGKAYLSGQMLRNRVSYVTVTGGIFGGNTYFGGYNSTAKEINSTIKGGTFNKAVYGGNCDGGETVNAQKVNTVIEGGIFNSSFYGASRGYVTGEVHTAVKGGTFNGTYYGGGYGKDAGEATSIGAITNEISGGVFNADYYGGSAYYTVESVTNKISGGSFKNVTGKNADGKTVSLYAFYGGSKGGSVTGNVTNVISGGTFDCHVILGSSANMGGSVINTISGGTFALTSCGAGKGEISGNVENTISGTAEFKKGFYCGYGLKESSATKITGNMINKVQPGPTADRPYFGRAPEYNLSKDGTVDSFYNIGNSDFGYMGGGNNSTISGYVENEISGGYFHGHWHGANNNGSVKGKNADGDGIVNKISGGTFAYRAYGGMVSPTTLTGNIRNEITGGLFKYEFAASHRAGAKTLTTTTYSHDIYTHISGDPVFEKYVCGVARGWNTEQSARVRLLGEAVLTIEGGTFKGDIYGLCNNGGYHNAAMPGARIDEGGSVTVNINGGTFSGQIYATSPTFDATLYHENGLATVKIAPTKGDVTLQKAVASRFANEVFTIGGGDKKLILASDAKITASSYDGKALELHRADGWTKGTTYLALPTAEANANITATKGESAKGELKAVVNGTETRWIGMDSTGVYGVNLILEQKIGLRLWLNKAEVDAIGEDFTYEITSEGKTLAAGTYAELSAKAEVKKQGETEYYTLVLGSLEPASFHKAILFGGDGLDPASYSINDILGIVIANENATFNEGFVTLAKSLWNYGIEAYNRFSGEASALAKETLSAPADAQIIASAADGTFADAKLVGRALVLREAVGLRVYLNLQNGVKAEDLTFTLNGTELGKELLHVREESGNGYNASVTVYVSAAAMNRTLNLSITMDGEAVGSYTDSIASVCQQYREAGGKDAALCTAILRYIQAVPGMND